MNGVSEYNAGQTSDASPEVWAKGLSTNEINVMLHTKELRLWVTFEEVTRFDTNIYFAVQETLL